MDSDVDGSSVGEGVSAPANQVVAVFWKHQTLFLNVPGFLDAKTARIAKSAKAANTQCRSRSGSCFNFEGKEGEPERWRSWRSWRATADYRKRSFNIVPDDIFPNDAALQIAW